MKQSHIYVIIIIFITLFSALIDPFLETNYFGNYKLLYFLYPLLYGILFYLWVNQYSKEKQLSPAHGRIWVVLCGVLGLPYFFFRNFSLKLASINLAIAFVIITCTLVTYVGIYLFVAQYYISA